MKRVGILLFAVALMTQPFGGIAFAVTSTTEVVRGNTSPGENQPGWLFNRDESTQSPYEFNGSAKSIGDGSLYVKPISGADKNNKFVAENFAKTAVSEFESFSYDFKIAGNGNAASANQFYANLYVNIDDSNNFYDCRYDFVPTIGSTSDFTKFTFNAETPTQVTKHRNSHIPTCPAKIADMPEGSHIRVFTINVGDTSTSLSDTGLAGYLDNVVLSTVGDQTTYDFELTKPKLTVTQPTEGEAVATTTNGNTLEIKGSFTDDVKANYANLQLVHNGVLVTQGTVYGYGTTPNPAATYANSDGSYTYLLPVPADIENGEYTLLYTGTDFAGGITDRMERKFIIDNTAPSTPTIKTPTNRQWFKSTPIKATWAASSDETSGVHNYQVAYRYDDGHTFGGSTCAGETINGLTLSGCRDTTSTSRNHTPGLGEQGGVTIWVRAIDNAGNKSAWSKSVHYFYDHEAPTGDITYPSDAATVVATDGKIVVSGTVTDNLSMNRVGVQLIKPGVSGHITYLYDHMVNQNPGVWEVEFDAAYLELANGTYGLNLYFVDMAGNVTTKKTTFTLNNPVPVVNTEDFGVGSWTLGTDHFRGLNVGFNVNDFTTIDNITVDLYDEDGKVVTNTASTALLAMLNDNGRIGPSLSTPFVTRGVLTDTWCDGNACWNLGVYDWVHTSKTPTHVVITVTGTDIYGDDVTKVVTNSTFSEAAGDFQSILPPANTAQRSNGNNNGRQLGAAIQSTFVRDYTSTDATDTTDETTDETTTSSVLAATDEADDSIAPGEEVEMEATEEPQDYSWLWWVLPSGLALAAGAWWAIAALRRHGE